MLLEIFQTTTVNIKQMQDTHGMRLADDWCDNWTKSDASGLVWIILFQLFIIVCILLEIVQTTAVNTKKIQDTHGMWLSDDSCDYWTKSDASGLDCRILFRSIIVFCMLLQIFQNTTVNTMQIQVTQGMWLANNDWCDYWTKSDASGLVWIILFQLFNIVCMLLQIIQTTAVNTKQIQDTHGIWLSDDSCDYWTKSDASGVVWMIFLVVYDFFRSKLVACLWLFACS
jgi:hypothetical protein